MKNIRRLMILILTFMLLFLFACTEKTPDVKPTQPVATQPAKPTVQLKDAIPDSAGADTFVMKDVTLNGDLSAGSTITFSGKLENHSNELRTFKIQLERPLLMTSNASDDNLYIPVEAGKSADFSYSIKIEEGGSSICRVKLLTEGDKVLCEEKFRVIAEGKGYYVGDAHTHSTLSDGHDTLKNNFQSVYNKGHAWILQTEHNFDPSQKKYATRAARGLDKFVPVVGNEITTFFGHMLEYNTTYMHPAGYSGHMWDIMAAIKPDVAGWQDIMNTIIKEDGLCYIAHPFYTGDGRWIWPGFEMDPTKVDYYKGFTGIEVYNADSHEYNKHKEWTEAAFELWDRYNLKGEQHYYGISNTDGHTKDIVGSTGNALHIDELTEENIINSLRYGTFYGTNGPEIRFTVGGASNGQSLKLPQSGKATLKLRVADQYSHLTKVVLYKYTIGGDVDKAYKNRSVTVLFDDADGSEGLHYFEYNQKIDVKNNEFYRVMVYSQSSLYGDTEFNGGFAFTNPVWIVD